MESSLKYRNILLIQTGFVGDMVLTTPLIRALRRAAPRSRITLLHAPRTESLVRRCPHLDDRIVLDKSGRGGRLVPMIRLATRLRREHFDLVISPHRSIRSGLLALSTGAGNRIGFTHYPASLFYTETVPYSRWESTFIRRKLRLLGPLGIAAVDDRPELYFGPEETEAAGRLLADANIDSPYAVLALGSAWPTKRWPPENFDELARILADRGIAPVFVGGDSDREAGARAAAAGFGADLTGRTSLDVLAALLAGARLFVGNDSGTLHLARAARIPAIALFGPTGPGQFRFDRLVRVIESDEPCAPCSDHGSTECPLGDWVCMPRIGAAAVAGVAALLLAACDDDPETGR